MDKCWSGWHTCRARCKSVANVELNIQTKTLVQSTVTSVSINNFGRFHLCAFRLCFILNLSLAQCGPKLVPLDSITVLCVQAEFLMLYAGVLAPTSQGNIVLTWTSRHCTLKYMSLKRHIACILVCLGDSISALFNFRLFVEGWKRGQNIGYLQYLFLCPLSKNNSFAQWYTKVGQSSTNLHNG